MSKLEELVPPLELCKKIPEGSFADSALVWNTTVCDEDDGEIVGVHGRDDCDRWMRGNQLPAPTLEEILRELTARGMDEPAVSVDGDQWTAYYEYHNSGGPMTPVASSSGAAAALLLWFQHLGIGE